MGRKRPASEIRGNPELSDHLESDCEENREHQSDEDVEDTMPAIDKVKKTPGEDRSKEKKKSSKPLKALSREKLEEYNERLAKRGVVYISRVPPNMRPNKVKMLLEQHGVISRVYLVEEDASSRRTRKKMGGNSGKRYTEGWVEFEDKKIAKAVAASLNTRPIGGKKGDYFRDDLWNLKYLKNFKWDHLTEKVAYERRVREQKLRLETMQLKRVNAAFLEKVEKGKAYKAMDERKKRKREESGSGEPASESLQETGAQKGLGGTIGSGLHRKFRQLQPVKDVGGGRVDDDMLKSVFARLDKRFKDI